MFDALILAASAPLAALLQPAFSLWGSDVSWAEVLAFALSVWMVVANMRVHPIGWPLAMLSSALYSLLFYNFQLYGEAALQWVFIGLAFWGWLQWRKGCKAEEQALRVRSLSPRALRHTLVATLLAWPLLAWLLQSVTRTDVAWWDALPTVGSITGQVLLARKYIENWPTWILVNLVSVGLFAYKGLWLTTLLYGLFTVMAWQGWQAWKRLEGQIHG